MLSISRKIIVASLLGLCAWPVRADTIITIDGRKFYGEVTPTDTGYLINGRHGMKRVSKDNLKQWIRDGLMDEPASNTKPNVFMPPSNPSTTTATTPGTPAKKVNTKISKTLQDQGLNALYAGDYRAARDSFLDALQIEPANEKLQQGLGLAYYYMGEVYRAAAALERALSRAPTDRSIAMDLAAVELKRNNPMRAVKILRESLAARPRELDEAMYNAIGTALDAADASARRNPYYKTCVDFHVAYNARLEAALPGMKHIGTHWYSQTKYGPQIARAQALKKKAEMAAEELTQVERDLAIARRELNRQEQIANTPGIDYLDDLEIYRKRVNRLENRRDILKDKIDSASDSELAINWPKYIPALGPSETKTPALVMPKEVVAVATTNPEKPKPTTMASSGNATTTEEPATDKPPKNPKEPLQNNPKPNNTQENTAPPEPPAAPVTTTVVPAVPAVTQVTQYAAGFAVTPTMVVTAADPLNGCKQIQMLNADGEPIIGELVRTDKTLGLALVRATNRKLTPLPLAAQFGGGAVDCAAFASIDMFAPVAEMISGSAPKPADAWKVNLHRHPRLPGAPLMADKLVVGVVMGTRDTDKTSLPAISLTDLKRFLTDTGPNGAFVNDPARAMVQVMAVREVRH